jgi:hypothetical protein
MERALEYIFESDKCQRLAVEATDPALKLEYLKLAKIWLTLAKVWRFEFASNPPREVH